MAKRLPSLTYRPRGRGVSKVLGDLESRTMERLWKVGSATVRDVHESLTSRRKELAYTTVMTVMSRLAEKGFLERTAEGNAYRYRPTVGRAHFVADASREVFAGLAQDLQGSVMSAFVDRLGESESETLEELARLIEERRRGKRP